MLPLDALHRMVTQIVDRLVDQVCEFPGEEDVAAERFVPGIPGTVYLFARG